MKKSFLFGAFLILSLLVSAQSYNWANAIGSLGGDIVGSMTTDANGNVYLTGDFSGTADFDPSANTATLTSGGTDIFIAKYDNNGNYLWAKAIVSNGSFFSDALGRSITTDESGNVYITGYFQDTTDFDPGPNTAILTTQSLGNSAVFVAKYDTNGNYLWAFASEGMRGDSKSITTDTNGNVYITGTFTGTGDFDPSANIANLTASMYYSVFIAKYDANGNYLWAKGIGSILSNYNGGMSIITDVNNNVYITGYFEGSAVDITTNSVILNSTGGDDIFIAKYDTNGNYLWAQSMGSSQSYDYGIAITTDIESNVYVTGRFSGMADFDPSINIANLTSSGAPYGGTDIFIAKYTTNGNYLWAYAIGDAGNDTGYSITTDINGNYVYIIGSIAGTTDFDPSVNTANLTSPGGNFLAKYDVNGNYIWAKTIGDNTLGADSGSLINVDGLGNIYVAGCFQGTVDFDSSISTATLTSVGNNDIFIIKYSPCYTVNNPQQVCGNYSIGTNTYSATGTYTNILQSVLNCDSVVITQLTIDPIPTISINSATICLGSSVTLIPSGADTYTITGNTFAVNPISTKLYTVIGTATNGCTNTAIATVSVGPVPTVSVNNAAICIGDSVLLTPNGADTYTISGGIFTVSPNSTTSYSIIGTSLIGCVSNNIAVATITVNSLALSVISTSVCQGSSANITASGATTYTWSTGATTSSINVIPSTSTIYTVTGTDLNNCRSTQTVSVTVDNTCSDVWPGDANSDGTADNLDVLELGLHYAQTGTPRASTSNSWQSYVATNWTSTITSGKNLDHSDCNGDGVIDVNDTLAIYLNYGLTHAFKPSQQTSTNEQLTIVPDQPMVSKGQWGTASVYLGTSANPISTINGLAFTLHFDQSLIEPNGIRIEYPVSFLNTGQNLSFRKQDYTNGALYAATTHTNNSNINGYGKIAVIHYQIKSSLVHDTVLAFNLVQATQSSASGNLVPLTSGSASVTAIGATVGINELLGNNMVAIYPNPANQFLVITSTQELQKVELVSVTGQVIISESASENQHQLDVSLVPNGIYVVTVYGKNNAIQRKKMVIQR